MAIDVTATFQGQQRLKITAIGTIPASRSRPHMSTVIGQIYEASGVAVLCSPSSASRRASAYHPQTLLAYDLNDKPLPVAHGAPLRVRIERQLGYKHAKYLMRIELVEHFKDIGDGNGGYWEDQGYEWYAGI